MRFFVTLNILILVLIVLRKLMKGKVSCRAQYFSWIILPVFMLAASFVSIPVAIERQQEAPSDKSEVSAYSKEEVSSESAGLIQTEKHYPSTVSSEENAQITAGSESGSQSVRIDLKHFAIFIWISGAAVIGSAILISNVSFARKIRKERMLFATSEFGKLKVYKIKGLDSPFLLWNHIYIPEDLDPSSERYSLSLYHEYCHYKLGDCFWNVIRNLFVTVLWFDPLVWIAYCLIQNDNELAVDEMVIRRNGEENRVKYGEMLLSYVSRVSEHSRIPSVATSMSGKNKSFMKKRILNIVNKSKATKYAAVILCTVLVTSSVCLLVRPYIVYKVSEKQDTVVSTTAEETEEKIKPAETTPSETAEDHKAVQLSNKKTFTPPDTRTIEFQTDNLIGAEDFKIPEDVDQATNIHVNCEVISITEKYMYICVRGVDWDKWENIYRICRYELVDGKQGDLKGSVDIDIACAAVMDVYEKDGKTYAILDYCKTALGYAFQIYELDFETGTATENRAVYAEDEVWGEDLHFWYARYHEGKIYAYGDISIQNSECKGVYYEFTEDGCKRVAVEDDKYREYDRILFPLYKL